MAAVGEPQREIYVEPLELPEPLRVDAPAALPQEIPAEEPVKQDVALWKSVR